MVRECGFGAADVGQEAASWVCSTRPRSCFGKHDEKAKDGVDKAADVVDDKTGGKHTETIDSGADKAKDTIDKLSDG